MDYTKHYELLVDRAKNRILEGYKENHHITPKCIGGTDDASNLVSLTAEEHFLAHQLLVKIYPNNAKLALAVSMMCIKNPRHQRNNKMYGWLRRAFSEAQRTKVRKTRAKETKPRKKRVLSEEHKLKIKEAWADGKYTESQPLRVNGRPHSDETKKKLSEINLGKVISEETKQKISQTVKSKPKSPKVLKEVVCPHCNKVGKGANMTRYHFDKCQTLLP